AVQPFTPTGFASDVDLHVINRWLQEISGAPAWWAKRARTPGLSLHPFATALSFALKLSNPVTYH
ncbi:MAG TPA: hypothetical protein VEW46_12840, partial [Pyrinomonadaceae bacterium]|nr:hypothetical protein [Pyrinomonadaceae bacterium]